MPAKLFRTRLKEQLRHDVVCLPNANAGTKANAAFERQNPQHVHEQHWKIELYHRMLRCNDLQLF